MTDESGTSRLEPEVTLAGFEPEALDGHSIDELSDYLDVGREPRDPTIENSPGCQIALDALTRLRTETWAMLEVEAQADANSAHNWLTNILQNISREAKAGRDIPISNPDPKTHLHVTEGSVRGLIRAAGDMVDGALVGKVDLDGDVTGVGEPITISITASARWGEPLRPLAHSLRECIAENLAWHTELNVIAVNVIIQDIHQSGAATSKERP